EGLVVEEQHGVGNICSSRTMARSKGGWYRPGDVSGSQPKQSFRTDSVCSGRTDGSAGATAVRKPTER
ncbi:unnamed protein product, partial [Ectocarpus fasciculatus]